MSDSPSPYAGLAAKIRPSGSVALATERASKPPVLQFALSRGMALLMPLVEPCGIFVDGKSAGHLTSDQRSTIQTTAGKHSIQVRSGLWRSTCIDIKVENGQVRQFVCTGHNSRFDFLFGMFFVVGLLLPWRFFILREFRR